MKLPIGPYQVVVSRRRPRLTEPMLPAAEGANDAELARLVAGRNRAFDRLRWEADQIMFGLQPR